MVRCWAFGPLFRLDLGDVAQVEDEREPWVSASRGELLQVAHERPEERILDVDGGEPDLELFDAQERRGAASAVIVRRLWQPLHSGSRFPGS